MLKQHPEIPFQEEAFLPESIEQETRESQRFVLGLVFLNKQLKISIPEDSFRMAKVWSPSHSHIQHTKASAHHVADMLNSFPFSPLSPKLILLLFILHFKEKKNPEIIF